MLDKYALARVIHVLSVVLWIGGVAMVTTVLIPAIRKMGPSADQVGLFERLESRFALQAKITTLLAGLSGFYMLDFIDAWGRYTEPKFWWVHAMTMVWVLFMFVLFVAEPLFLHRLFKKHAQRDPVKTFAIVHRLHLILLAVSLVTMAGAVAGSHGWFVF
ncbi:MAG TPA: hypothetical protein QGI03_09185 [Dehalococcoidia bacterium]|jgi:uncharacterized membrane protein|nr:hypothetical protein [Dehalococcoidia bacterium]|tara:strand:- start:590 stop:1069 length:480 start_codon:yes stop_codon:yes gene_type:complete